MVKSLGGELFLIELKNWTNFIFNNMEDFDSEEIKKI